MIMAGISSIRGCLYVDEAEGMGRVCFGWYGPGSEECPSCDITTEHVHDVNWMYGHFKDDLEKGTRT